MNIGGWFFCRDRVAQVELDASVAEGATSISVTGADGIYSVGQLLCISEADGSEPEFLGGVREVEANAVEFALPVRAAKSARALLWIVAESFHLDAENAQPFTRRVASGVALERALGGTHYAIRTAATRETLDLKLEGMTPPRERALHAWLALLTQNGLLPFTLVAPDRRLFVVRLDVGVIERAERDAIRASIRLPLIIESEGAYQ